jgi:hypothetical protein
VIDFSDTTPDPIPPDSDPVSPAEADQGFAGDELVRRIPFGALVICTLGFMFALFALLVLRWPVNPTAPIEVAPHMQRITQTIEGESTPAMVSRLILNIGIYIIMLIALIALIIGWLRGGRAAARTLILMALLGLMYVTGMALYLSGSVAVFGFCLMLFGALLAWVATERLERPQDGYGKPKLQPLTQPSFADSAESLEE